MEALIEATLADGVLTDQEKTALVNRAKKEGVDLNELEIYIQSILQKRQKELDKKSREARAQKEEADLESEKLRSKILRECPNCGTRIPHLSNACPNCGFVIDKTEIDETLVVLKSLLDHCSSHMTIFNGTLSFRRRIRIPQDKYNQYKKYLTILNCSRNEREKEAGNFFCEINPNVVLAEASLYRNNESIKESLSNIRDKIVGTVEDCLNEAKSTLRVGSKEYGNIRTYEKNIGDAKKLVRILKSDYSELVNDEIYELEDKINKIEKQYDNIETSSEFQMAAAKAEKGVCLGIMLLMVVLSSTLCSMFLL